MKKLMFSTVLCLTMFAAVAAEPQNTTEELKKLEQQQAKLAVEMRKTRMELISKDPDIQRMHKQIMALHKELELKIDNTREMRSLLFKEAELAKKMEELKKSTVKK